MRWGLLLAGLLVLVTLPSVRSAISQAAGLTKASSTVDSKVASAGMATGYAPGTGQHSTSTHTDTVQVALAATPAPGEPLPSGWTQTSSGPLGPVDRDFLVKVRLAGLWEGPAGKMAQTRAGDQRVKEVGAQLAADHVGLDDAVRKAAQQLGVVLPNEPNSDQQGWLKEMTNAKTPAEFDSVFANRLRAAHGKVFALISSVRAGTRNDLIREFAQTGINVVMKHMTLLESIGNVDFQALPEPVAAAPAAKPAEPGNWRPDAVWGVAGLALIVGAIAAFRIFRGMRAARRRPAY